ncbi:bifunctional 2-polyprenyl-6-hydroxyphenol methylase/3-demethylubiquinol 3-O-methyltransferase UbiG [Arachnia propionica]|uniref:Class I SAM-dependent methyltransferase n=1 Tax=Arachnia propionica TaxID=1750 RepID=A0A3P1WPZ6_9ACTN|nr:class I SAM-dependent methyltransferase [Arachnia propionica]RRD48699.1 class I SAM-dependent methyltransferase [Arachnia propionica]
MTPEPSQWARMIAADPDHSHRYIQRFKNMEAAGHDLYGEARLIDAMTARGSRILDAGCGPGRHCGWLHERGHQVVGVDLDPVLIEAAEQDHPGPTYVVGDLAELDLSAHGITEGFDLIFSAGNVMGFLAPSTRVEVLRRLGTHLAAEGRLVIGYGAGRGYEFEDFFTDAGTAGLRVDQAFSTWDLRPFTPDSGFLVAVLTHAAA